MINPSLFVDYQGTGGAATGAKFDRARARRDRAEKKQMQKDLAEYGEAVEDASYKVVLDATTRLKNSIRREVAQNLDARGKRRPENAIRGEIYDRKDGGYTGFVYSKFGRVENGRYIDYLLPHIKGSTLRPEQSGWLYIPNRQKGKSAGSRRGERLDVSAKKSLSFVPARDNRKLYIVRASRKNGAQVTRLIATLVRSVRHDKKLEVPELWSRQSKAFQRDLYARMGDVGESGALRSKAGLHKTKIARKG